MQYITRNGSHFVLFCCALIPDDIIQDYFTGTGAILLLTSVVLKQPGENGYKYDTNAAHYIDITKQNEAKTILYAVEPTYSKRIGAVYIE